MNLNDFLKKHPLNHSMIIGYYGGGNYGDELLLEIIQSLAHQTGAKDIAIAYKDLGLFNTYHHDLGYKVTSWSPLSLLRTWIGKRQVVVGGGGLWGLDADFKILILSMLLFVSRWFFAKRVYLLDVGFYNSTSRLGRISAWLAAKGASTILARDHESFENFKRFQSKTYLDRDIAWYLHELDLGRYDADVDTLERSLHITGKTLIVGIREFKTPEAQDWNTKLEQFIAANPDRSVIAIPFKSPDGYPEGHALIKKWQQNFPWVQASDSRFNPLVFYRLLERHSKRLALMAPQFHVIVSAHLHDIPFLPVVYDNKVSALLDILGVTRTIRIEAVQTKDLQGFADTFYETERA